MEDSDVICYCMGVKVREIKEAVANGAKTLEDVKDKTSAATGCGRCRTRVAALIEELNK